MPSTTINPTRQELNRLKNRLRTSIRGHKLLKDKRDELMKQFMDVVRENRALRKRVEEGLMRAHGAFTVAAALMGISRMYCYVHYPTDVLAGIVVGTLAGLAAAHLIDWLEQRRRAKAPEIGRAHV